MDDAIDTLMSTIGDAQAQIRYIEQTQTEDSDEGNAARIEEVKLSLDNAETAAMDLVP